MKSFGLKFIDIMIGIVLGLGFQWWPALSQPWQYVAFIFVYVDIIDYWIDYGPALRKFPPKREFDLILDVGIMFTLFLYIYATQLSIIYFLLSFIAFKMFDMFWLLRAKFQHHPTGREGTFIQTWITSNTLEAVVSTLLVMGCWFAGLTAPITLAIFIAIRLILRVFASYRYRQIHFV